MGSATSDKSKGLAAIPDFVDNAAKNLTDKPTQSIGQTLSDLWQLVLGNRVSFKLEKQRMKYACALEEYRESLDAKVAAIPEEKRIEPSTQIAAQALDDSKYCVESAELREMFAHLIASSMHADYADKAHPSFSKIIQQMSALDAQMLEILHRYQSCGGLAVVNYKKVLSAGGFEPLVECIPEKAPESCSLEIAGHSIAFLQRLGLIQIPAFTHFSNDDRYAAFQRTSLHAELNRQATVFGYKLEMEGSLARLTPVGQDFVSVCLG